MFEEEWGWRGTGGAQAPREPRAPRPFKQPSVPVTAKVLASQLRKSFDKLSGDFEVWSDEVRRVVVRADGLESVAMSFLVFDNILRDVIAGPGLARGLELSVIISSSSEADSEGLNQFGYSGWKLENLRRDGFGVQTMEATCRWVEGDSRNQFGMCRDAAHRAGAYFGVKTPVVIC